jgi:hypothetical protein
MIGWVDAPQKRSSERDYELPSFFFFRIYQPAPAAITRKGTSRMTGSRSWCCI